MNWTVIDEYFMHEINEHAWNGQELMKMHEMDRNWWICMKWTGIDKYTWKLNNMHQIDEYAWNGQDWRE